MTVFIRKEVTHMSLEQSFATYGPVRSGLPNKVFLQKSNER